MYNFLIAVGIIFIILGLYGERVFVANKVDIYMDDKPSVEAEDKDIESISFEEVLESIKIDEIDINQKEDTISSNDNEAFDIIEKYEAGEYTLEEICNILNMKKGEVLLLRNIYKKSQD